MYIPFRTDSQRLPTVYLGDQSSASARMVELWSPPRYTFHRECFVHPNRTPLALCHRPSTPGPSLDQIDGARECFEDCGRC